MGAPRGSQNWEPSHIFYKKSYIAPTNVDNFEEVPERDGPSAGERGDALRRRMPPHRPRPENPGYCFPSAIARHPPSHVRSPPSLRATLVHVAMMVTYEARLDGARCCCYMVVAGRRPTAQYSRPAD